MLDSISTSMSSKKIYHGIKQRGVMKPRYQYHGTMTPRYQHQDTVTQWYLTPIKLYALFLAYNKIFISVINSIFVIVIVIVFISFLLT